MLTRDEQVKIIALADALYRVRVLAKGRVKSGLSSPRAAAASVKKSLDKLKDYLKEVG